MGLAQKKEQGKRREFDFHDSHFSFVRQTLFENTGITLSDIKRDMVYSRLIRRIRALNMHSFDEYLNLLKKSPEKEMVEFTNALTTNLTSFFRENHHFEYLSSHIFPELSKRKGQRRLRIWSAGCSTGEEPYSLAITLKNNMRLFPGWDVKILATDLDSNVVNTAKAGIYAQERIDGLPKALVSRWFNKGKGDLEGKVKVKSELQDIITFKQLNLMNAWPMQGPFDIIFCRNVVIYFNKDTQRTLFGRYADYLDDNAYLIVGHSESLHGVTKRFRLLGKTIYQKV